MKKKPLILIVDDIQKNIQVIGNILRATFECEIAFATDGRKALKMTRTLKPDLVLLDIMMPEMDGFDVCRTIKEDKALSEIPIIFLTARTEPEDLANGLQAGAVDYITKPFNSMELIARITTQLKLKEKNDLILQQANERKELLHVLCHDLTNPLANILTMISLLPDDADTKSIQEFKEFIVKFSQNALDIIEMIRKMRALAEKKISIHCQDLNLSLLVHESCLMLEKQLKKKDITMKIDIDESLIISVEIISFINSVLNNLLTNAIKFSTPGSRVEIKADKNDNMVVLRIMDHGIGMSPILASEIFDINKATTRPGTLGEQGTGFGLPLVKKFINAYGGDIEVSSRDINEFPEDHGTEFKLILPSSAQRE